MKFLSVIWFRIISYTQYWFQANSNHYLHSPFIFEWYQNLNNFKVMEMEASYRNTLKNNKQPFQFDNNQTTVSQRYLRTSISKKYGRQIHSTAQFLKAKNFLELGTSLGVSTMYLSSSNNNITGHSIDLNPNAIEVTKSNFEKHELDQRTVFHIGSFDDCLEDILDELIEIEICFIDGDHSYSATIENTKKIMYKLSTNAIIILDDIRWSRDMFKAWKELKELKIFNYTVDYGRMGYLFKVDNQKMKEHFVLK